MHQEKDLLFKADDHRFGVLVARVMQSPAIWRLKGHFHVCFKQKGQAGARLFSPDTINVLLRLPDG
jgi:hypothetical protein